jgi:Tol biopolymer transport system component
LPLPPLALDASGGGVIAYISEPGGVPGVQIMNADGSDQRRLTDTYQLSPSWSPDGQQIIFANNNDSDPWSISTVDVLSGEITGVTDLYSSIDAPGSPDWSPDGNSFAMIYEYDLYTMNTSGGAVKKLIHFSGDVGTFSPDWSADGQQLAFVVDFVAGADNYDIYRSDADGSNVVQLTSHEAHDREPAWSSDGTKIAFESYRDGNWELFTMNADGSNIQNISNSPDRENRPAWSPDGARIAFQSDRDGNWEIYVMNADGTDVQRLTDNDVKDIQPEWRP